jgi:hypothetical protein
MPVHLARRFGGRGEPLADLTQLAAIGDLMTFERGPSDASHGWHIRPVRPGGGRAGLRVVG